MDRHRVSSCSLASKLPVVIALVVLLVWAGAASAGPAQWRHEWPDTDFAKHSIDLDEIISGGPPKDGIPSIDQPEFKPVAEIEDIGPQEPVIGLTIEGDARAYPLRILTWHEIVNDEVGGVPVAVTYCPLCNSAIVFDRWVAGAATEFDRLAQLTQAVGKVHGQAVRERPVLNPLRPQACAFEVVE